jgi:hypothetical protein
LHAFQGFAASRLVEVEGAGETKAEEPSAEPWHIAMGEVVHEGKYTSPSTPDACAGFESNPVRGMLGYTDCGRPPEAALRDGKGSVVSGTSEGM